MADAYVVVRNIKTAKRGATANIDLKSVVRAEYNPDLVKRNARGGDGHAAANIDVFAGEPNLTLEIESVTEALLAIAAMGTKEKVVLTYDDGGTTKTVEILAAKLVSHGPPKFSAKEDGGRVPVMSLRYDVMMDEIGSTKALYGTATGVGVVNFY